MILNINGTNKELNGNFQDKHLSELLKEISRSHLDQNQIITQVKLNGKEISLDEEKNLGKFCDLKIESLEIKSDTPYNLARTYLTDAKEYLKNLVTTLESLAHDFRGWELEEAGRKFTHVLDIIDWFYKIIPNLGSFLGIRYDKIIHKGKTLNQKLKYFEMTLEVMADAQERTDFIHLADVIEYELLPFFQEWQEIIPVLEKTAEEIVKVNNIENRCLN
ncbi:MAG: hypothetical protein SV062_05970 [Thermodesulfobacteriota bacterium]|nr:hypothetical protein [Thermodesulfobacteriota bacterium]